MNKMNEVISSSERKTVSDRYSIDWTESFEGINIPHRKQECLDCDIGKICSDSVIKPKLNCFNCKMERAFDVGLDQLDQKKTYSTNINMLKTKPANEHYQMLP